MVLVLVGDKMKKIIMIGIFVILILGVVGVNALITNYSSLGYSIEITEVLEEQLLEDCFTINEFTTTDSIRETAVSEATKRSAQFDTKGSISLYVIPEENSVCWSLPVTITTQEKEVVYSDKSIIEDINSIRYDFDSKKWARTISKEVISSSSEICYDCDVEGTNRCDCISVSGSRCYYNEAGNYDTCRSGAVYGGWTT